MENKIPLLTAEQIEVKIKQVGSKGAVALLYKTARTDMDILDSIFGADMWECDYKEIKGNLYCGIGVYTDGGQIWKWDCGIESRTDDEGNEKKGEASDAFKRAGTKWGIGRELYTAPFIWLEVPTEANGKSYKLKDKFQTFDVSEIGYDDDRRINKLIIKDNKGKVVYSYGVSGDKKQTGMSSGFPEWDEALSEFIAVGGNPEAFAKYCKKARVEDLSTEELLYGIACKRKKESA